MQSSLCVCWSQVWALQKTWNDQDVLIKDLAGASRTTSDSWTGVPQVPTTERYAAGFSAAHRTYHKFIRSIRRTEMNFSWQVQFGELQKRISYRCSAANCTDHYAYQKTFNPNYIKFQF